MTKKPKRGGAVSAVAMKAGTKDMFHVPGHLKPGHHVSGAFGKRWTVQHVRV